MATNQQCKFILNKKSNCARRQAAKYDGLCKYHFDMLSDKEQEEILVKGNKELQAKSKVLKESRAAKKDKAAIIVKADSELAVLEDHQRLVLLTTIQARDIEELKEQLSVAKELSKAQQQNIDSHLKITDVIKREIERASRR